MRIWFNGAEVPEHRETLARLGAKHVAFNMAPIVQQRNGNAGDRDGLDPFETVFYTSQLDVDSEAMQQVVANYSDSESLVLDLPSDELPLIPLWDGQDLEDLYEMAVTYGQVAITEPSALEVANQRSLTMFVRRNPHVRIWCNTSKTKILAMPFVTDAIVTGWLHSSKYRELQMWDGKKVLRVPRDSRIKAIETHRVQIGNLGEDADLLIEGDMLSNVSLAVKSWLQYERVVTTLTPFDNVEAVLVDPDTLATPTPEPAHREPETLPILSEPDGNSFEDEDGNLRPRLQVRSGTLRQCDTCFVNQVCPGFAKHASCKYEIPIVVRTTEERAAVDELLLDIQLQRALEQRFFEQLQGGGATKEASSELDRYVRMREGVQRSRTTRTELTISATGESGGGIMSQLFGPKAGEANRELPAPVSSDELILDADVVDS